MHKALAAGVLFLASCRGCDDPPKRAGALRDGGDGASSEASGRSGPDAEPLAPDAAVFADAAPPVTIIPADEDAGASACRLLYGPSEQPFRGPAAMIAKPGELLLVANDGGKPRIFTVPIAAPGASGAPPVVPPRPSSFVGMRWPPCELAGKFVYCQGPGGPITRTTLGASDTKTMVTKTRAGTRIAAAPLGADHSVVAFLDVRQTTEGAMLQAFALLDDTTQPVRISDDGAGATTLRALPRGEGAVIVYLDTRTAMVPIHARAVSRNGNDLALGDDAVLFVGGAAERGIDLALAASGKNVLALVPMPRETADFGMAAIPVHDPPKDDVGAAWSLYPNGLDPAPIAASATASGEPWVARVRPKERMPGARRVLELGRLDAKGTFRSYGIVSEDKAITDIALAVDAHGAAWILYGDANATWLERRLCP